LRAPRRLPGRQLPAGAGPRWQGRASSVFRRVPVDRRRERALFDDVGVHAFQCLAERPARPSGSPSKNRLRTAYDMLSAMGAEAFAERARRELLATGDTVRKRTVQTASGLTAQEAHIARLAVDGRTNVEIGAQLYLSTRTVEWHLSKVYTKLGVGSRRELRAALASLGQADPQA